MLEEPRRATERTSINESRCLITSQSLWHYYTGSEEHDEREMEEKTSTGTKKLVRVNVTRATNGECTRTLACMGNGGC